MKKIVLLFLTFGTLHAVAQQDPYFTHFKDVMQVYNPAAAGHAFGEICISGLTHHQWRDFDDATPTSGTAPQGDANNENVAPVTYNLNVNTVFQLDQAKTQFLGAGITIVDDQVSYTTATTFMVNLNYRKQFQGGFHEISGGLGIGGTQWGWDQPNFLSREQNDPNIPIGGANEMNLDLNLGVMYKAQSLGPIDNFYAGLSGTNLNQAEYNIVVPTQGNTTGTTMNWNYVPHMYSIVGGDINVGAASPIVLEPALLVKFGPFKPQLDINMTALFAGKLRGGIAFRQFANADAASLLIGYQTAKLKVGYAYDITLSNVQSVSNGTHEIFVRYCIPINFEIDPEILKESVRFL